jgi:cytochrome c oxidase assembly protein subunit 15
MTAQNRFAAYAWFVLAFSIVVVLWGAGVRATGSGAGCGDQWPLCNGGWFPRAPALQTIIEFTHRITSGPTLGLFVIIPVVFAFRLFPRRHMVRSLSVLVALFTVTEALIWRRPRSTGPCRSEFVAKSRVHTCNSPAQYDDPARGNGAYRMVCRSLGKRTKGGEHGTAGLSISTHLRTRRLSCDQRNGRDCRARRHAVRGSLSRPGATAGPFALSPHFCAPACLASDCRHSARMFAGAVAVVILNKRPASLTRRLTLAVVFLTLLQAGAGAINVLLLTPVWMQITHLFIADLLWMALVLLSAEVIAFGGRSAVAVYSPGVRPASSSSSAPASR